MVGRHLIVTTWIPENNVPHYVWCEDRRNFRRKAHFLADGHNNQTPASMVYSYMASR